MEKDQLNFKDAFKGFVSSSHFVVVFLLTFTQMILISFLQMVVQKDTYNDQQAMKFAVLSFFTTVIFSALLRLYCSFHMGKILKIIEDEDFSSMVKRTALDWTVVEIRAQFRVLVGLLLFIIPGLIEALRLSLSTPYVFYDKRMDDKTFDPIHESRRVLDLQNKKLLPLFALTMLAPLIIFLALQNGAPSFFESFGSMLRSAFVSLILSLLTTCTFLYLAFLYKESTSTNNNKITTEQRGEL